MSTCTSETTSKVFVYCSLMKNCYNHDYYLQGKEFLGQGVLTGYALYELGSYPGIIPDREGKVRGEVYAIDSRTLARLDALEGNGSLYMRETSAVMLGDEKVMAEIYVWNGQVDQSARIYFTDQPWGAKMNLGGRQYE